MQPIRELGSSVAHVPADRVRPLAVPDFAAALEAIKPSVGKQQLSAYVQWTKEFGSV
jgi:Vps4 C terminal oligomerisation domain